MIHHLVCGVLGRPLAPHVAVHPAVDRLLPPQTPARPSHSSREIARKFEISVESGQCSVRHTELNQNDLPYTLLTDECSNWYT